MIVGSEDIVFKDKGEALDFLQMFLNIDSWDYEWSLIKNSQTLNLDLLDYLTKLNIDCYLTHGEGIEMESGVPW